MDGFEVEIEKLRGHADAIEGNQDGVGQALDASRHVTGLDDAYGIYCQMLGLPGIMRQPQQTGADLIATVNNRLTEDASKIDATAEAYNLAESTLLAKIAELQSKLDSAAPVPTFGGR